MSAPVINSPVTCALVPDAGWQELSPSRRGHQVLGDGPVAAGELGHETLGIRVPGQREHREPQPGRPALRPLLEHRGHVVGQSDPGSGHELPGLLLGEAQLRGSDLGQLAGQP